MTHAVGQLSPHSSTREKAARCNEEPVAHKEISYELQLRPSTAKNKTKKTTHKGRDGARPQRAGVMGTSGGTTGSE